MILGPCSAESREQVLLTASQLKEACGDTPFIFRAGVWKARTNPHTFQGAGTQALEWLKEVKATYCLPIATEVVSVEHVEQAIAAGVDYLWIGARTAANPIAVQEIADAIKVKDERLKVKGLLVKNPVNADADLWLGNIERLEKTGVPVMAIHRGCNHQPCWAVAHKVRTARPDIPMLLDPSHMSGDAAQVPALLEKIPELGLDGAMIEVHCCPKDALSDNNQQITPLQLGNALHSLSCRYRVVVVSLPSVPQEELNWLRAEIDELDERLWDTIVARMEVSERIGKWKKAHDVTPLQPERFQQIASRAKQMATQSGLSEDFAQQLIELIHTESLRQQQ